MGRFAVLLDFGRFQRDRPSFLTIPPLSAAEQPHRPGRFKNSAL